MSNLHLVAAILTVAVQERPERRHLKHGVPVKNVHEAVLSDYREILGRLAHLYPEQERAAQQRLTERTS